MSTFAKYMDRYKSRLKQEEPALPNTSRLTTDRNAYIAFLEVQLERVTQSCGDVQRVHDKLSHVEAQVTHNSERMAKAFQLLSREEALDERMRVLELQIGRADESRAQEWQRIEERVAVLEGKGPGERGIELNGRLAQMQIESTVREEVTTLGKD